MININIKEIKTVEDLVVSNIPDCVKIDVLHRIINSLELEDGSNIVNNKEYERNIEYANMVLQNELNKNK